MDMGTDGPRRLVYMSASVLPSAAANSVHVIKMSDAFATLGLEVDLIGLKNDAQPLPEAELRRVYGVSDRFSIRRIARGGLTGYRMRYALGILVGGWAPAGALIYTRVPKIAALAARLGRRCILEIHHPPSRGNAAAVRQHLRARSGGILVVITRTLGDWAVQTLGISPERVIVAPDGADPFPDGVMPALPPSDRCRIGYLGHLHPGKGIELIAQLAPRLPEADFVVVGGSPEALALWRERKADLPNLRFVGQVPHGQTPSWLRSFDVALLPNQLRVYASGGGPDIGRWTSPLKAFEYMAAGLPIVASDLENLREIFTNGDTALLCPPEDATAWEAAIRALLARPESRRALGARAAARFAARYTWAERAQVLGRRLDLNI